MVLDGFTGRRLTAASTVVIALAVLAGGVDAQQTGSIVGRVRSDSAGVALGGAGIRIPQLDRVVQADSAGLFRVERLAPGTYLVIAEAPGFRARRAVVELGAGETRTQDFVLEKGAQILRTVDVRAKAPPRVSPKMVDFERRRQRGYGRFVTREELERFPGRQLEEVLRSTAVATRFVKSPSGQTWLISSRQVATNHGLIASGVPDQVRNTTCHVQVVLDGAIVSSSTAIRAPRIYAGSGATGGRAGVSDPRTQVQGGDDPIDLNLFFSDQLEGVEFYPDATTTPMEYRTAAAVCGTLVLWTRDK